MVICMDSRRGSRRALSRRRLRTGLGVGRLEYQTQQQRQLTPHRALEHDIELEEAVFNQRHLVVAHHSAVKSVSAESSSLSIVFVEVDCSQSAAA